MTLRVLIVEDEMTIAFMIEDMLEGMGHEIAAVAMRLSDALQAARTLPVDFALLDVNLDGLRSFAVAEALEARGVPFAFVTGYGASGVQPPFDNRPVLAKPFLPADLERILAATPAARA